MNSRSQHLYRPQIGANLGSIDTEPALDLDGHVGGELSLAGLEESDQRPGYSERVSYVLLCEPLLLAVDANWITR